MMLSLILSAALVLAARSAPVAQHQDDYEEFLDVPVKVMELNQTAYDEFVKTKGHEPNVTELSAMYVETEADRDFLEAFLSELEEGSGDATTTEATATTAAASTEAPATSHQQTWTTAEVLNLILKLALQQQEGRKSAMKIAMESAIQAALQHQKSQ